MHHSPTPRSAASIAAGMSVCLTQAHGFYERGDTGTAVLVDPEGAWVAFDGGAHDFLPLSILTEHVREFRYRFRGWALSQSYASEDAANDAALAGGLLEWETVELRSVATNTVEHTDEPAIASGPDADDLGCAISPHRLH